VEFSDLARADKAVAGVAPDNRQPGISQQIEHDRPRVSAALKPRVALAPVSLVHNWFWRATEQGKRPGTNNLQYGLNQRNVPPGTHKQTYQERMGGLTTEIREKMRGVLHALLMTPMTGIT
jgi:hypothetical protein